MLFGLPVVQITLFGFALTNEIKNSEIIALDQSHDGASRRIIDKIAASTNFEITKEVSRYNEIEKEFKKGKIKVAVIFAPDFNSQLIHGNVTGIKIIADACDPNTATALTNYITAEVKGYQQEIAGDMAPPYQIIPEVRMLYNPELKGATNFVPGVMSLVLMLVCVLMTSVSIVREKEKGTMEVLLVSPFNPILVIISKAVPYFLLSLVNLIVILLLSVYLLGLPVNGSIILLFLVSALFIITSLSLGLLISNVTSSEQSAMLASLMGMMIPTLLLAGFMFPVENMPRILQVISNIVPAKWYYTIVKAIMIKGLGFRSVIKEVSILTGMTVFLLALSYKKFKVRLE